MTHEPNILKQLQTGACKFVTLHTEEFSELPQGCIASVKSVSYSNLQTGDFILVNEEDALAAKRFVRRTLQDGITRLVVTDGQGHEQAIPFTRLIGLIEAVRHGEDGYNPNPTGFFQRTAFALKQRFGGRSAA